MGTKIKDSTPPKTLKEVQQIKHENLICKRTIELLIAAGHVTQETVEKAREIATSFTD